ncbi:MAG: carbohydrate ABC transporter permease [Caldilineaceae bacterium]
MLVVLVGFYIYWTFVVSVTPNSRVFAWPLEIWPTTPTLDHYTEVLRMGSRGAALVPQQCDRQCVGHSGSLFFSSLTAYGFARLRFPGSDAIFLGILFTLMVPGQVTLIRSSCSCVIWAGSTLYALIWPAAANVFGVFLLRQFFLRSIPTELEEAAFMDGRRFRIYWQIILPLARSAMIALMIFTFLGSWNDLFWPRSRCSTGSKCAPPWG